MTPARASPARASISNGPAVTRGSVARVPPASCGSSGLGALGRRALHRGRLAAVLACADLHPARLALLGLRDPDLEHALVELRGHSVGVDPLGQRQRTAERAR